MRLAFIPLSALFVVNRLTSFFRGLKDFRALNVPFCPFCPFLPFPKQTPPLLRSTPSNLEGDNSQFSILNSQFSILNSSPTAL